jgi:hypothetical protein
MLVFPNPSRPVPGLGHGRFLTRPFPIHPPSYVPTLCSPDTEFHDCSSFQVQRAWRSQLHNTRWHHDRFYLTRYAVLLMPRDVLFATPSARTDRNHTSCITHEFTKRRDDEERSCCWTWGSRGGDYEECGLQKQLSFRRNILTPSSGSKIQPSKKPEECAWYMRPDPTRPCRFTVSSCIAFADPHAFYPDQYYSRFSSVP